MDVREVWRRRHVAIRAFVLSRLVLGAAQLAGSLAGGGSLADRWDGAWYLRIARYGYPPTLLLPGQRFSSWAFFPLYPMIIVGAHTVTGLPEPAAAVLVNVVLGAVLAVVLWRLARAVAGPWAADRASVLFWWFPGSAVLGMAYSEPVFLVAACASLLWLVKRRWLLAGLAGAAATAARPSGIAVAAACLTAAYLALRTPRDGRRDWAALAAPLLCPLGLVGFLLFGRARTGDLLIWRRAERRWHQNLDLSIRLPLLLYNHLHPSSAQFVQSLLLLVGLVTLAAALVLLVRGRVRLPPALVSYLVVLVVLTLGYSHVSARFRFLTVMVPLFIVAARRLSRRRYVLTAGGFGALLAVSGFLYASPWHVVP